MDSDDSDFYGDSNTVLGLQNRVRGFNIESFIQQQDTHSGRPKRQALPSDTSHLHNPYAGVSYAWQLNETVDHFLGRLPPDLTAQDETTPWIFICNPYILRVEKRLSDGQFSKGNEDEAPEEEGSRPSIISEGGLERLQLVTQFIEDSKKLMKAHPAIEREINKERKRAVDDILSLAHAAKVRTGKWMLFCPPGEVNEVWRIIAKATANNELGLAAKVAPKPDNDDPRKDRLICVYTADFKDKPDVGRVLQKLRELRLVEAKGRPIYYKPDAFTYIGISHGNPWGVKASIYSSLDIFA